MPYRPTRRDLEPLPLTHQQSIPEDYLDEMGHVNVLWYTHLSSRATAGIFKLIGFTHDYMEREKAGTFALEVHVRYFQEIRVDENISLFSRVLGRTQSRLHAMNFFWNDDRENLAATLEFVSAHMDMTVRRMSPFPPQMTDKLDELIAQQAELAWTAPICGSMGP